MHTRMFETGLLIYVTGRWAGRLVVGALLFGIFAFFALILFGAAAGHPNPGRDSLREAHGRRRELIRKYAPENLKDYDAGTGNLYGRK